MKKFLESTKKEFFLLLLTLVPYIVLGTFFVLIPFARHSGRFWISWHVGVFMVSGAMLAYIKSHFQFRIRWIESVTNILLTFTTWTALVLALVQFLLLIPFLFFFSLFSRTQPIVHAVVWILGHTLTFLLGIRVEIEGERPKEMFIGAPNHASSLDYFLIIDILGPRPAKFMAGKNLMKFPIFNFFLKLKCIFVDRKSEESRKQSAKECQACIKQGIPLVIFFEGGRKRRSEVGVLKEKSSIPKGVFVLSKRNNIPILPIAIIGAGDFKPPTKGEPLAKKWWKFQWWNSPTQIKASFLPLVRPGNLTLDQLKDEVWDSLESKILQNKKKTVLI